MVGGHPSVPNPNQHPPPTGSLFDTGVSGLDVDQNTFEHIISAIQGYDATTHSAPCAGTFTVHMSFSDHTQVQISGKDLLGEEVSHGRCRVLVYPPQPESPAGTSLNTPSPPPGGNNWAYGAPFFKGKTVYFSHDHGVGFDTA